MVRCATYHEQKQGRSRFGAGDFCQISNQLMPRQCTSQDLKLQVLLLGKPEGSTLKHADPAVQFLAKSENTLFSGLQQAAIQLQCLSTIAAHFS